MKKPSFKKEGVKKSNVYNIFNDLMEYELECKLNSLNDDASENESQSDTDDHIGIINTLKTTVPNGRDIPTPSLWEGDHFSETAPLGDSLEEDENYLYNESAPLETFQGNDCLREDIVYTSQRGDFYPTPKSLSYPPGFDNTFSMDWISNQPIENSFTLPSNDLNKSDIFIKKKYIYNRNNFKPWPSPFSYEPAKSHNDFGGDDNKSQNEVKKNTQYDVGGNILTKKFYFGDITKGMKCIKSFGIILYVKNKNIWRINNDIDIKYLLYQRRDTYAFMDFMRGLWNSETKMLNLLSSISKDERKRLLNYNFDELWDDLWVSHSTDINGIYIARKDYAKKKFNSVYEQMVNILNNKIATGEAEICDAPWGFPKGKKNSKESDIECAKREFIEETQLDLKDINITYDSVPIIENYIADNGKYYTTFYYIAEVPKILPIKYINTPGCIRKTAVSDEVANLIWSNYTDAKLLLDSQKLTILDEAHKRIVNKK